MRRTIGATAIVVAALVSSPDVARAQGMTQLFLGLPSAQKLPAYDEPVVGLIHHLTEVAIDRWIRDHRPCVEVTPESGIRAMAQFLKLRAQLGAKEEGDPLAEIAGATGARYVTTGSIVRDGGGWFVRMILFDQRRSRPLGSMGVTLAYGKPLPPYRISEAQLQALLDGLPECRVTLKVHQILSAKRPDVVGVFEGEVPLEVSPSGEVRGEGSFDGVLVPVTASDKVSREASITARSSVAVEGTVEDGYMNLTVRGTGAQLTAGGRTFGGGADGGRYIVRLRFRPGSEERTVGQKLGGYEAIVTHTLVKRK